MTGQSFTMGRPGVPDRRIYRLTHNGVEVYRGRSPMRFVRKWEGPELDIEEVTK